MNNSKVSQFKQANSRNTFCNSRKSSTHGFSTQSQYCTSTMSFRKAARLNNNNNDDDMITKEQRQQQQQRGQINRRPPQHKRQPLDTMRALVITCTHMFLAAVCARIVCATSNTYHNNNHHMAMLPPSPPMLLQRTRAFPMHLQQQQQPMQQRPQYLSARPQPRNAAASQDMAFSVPPFEPLRRAPADRRTSGAGPATQPQPQPQQQPEEQRMLVCYYTTRQAASSAPYWLKDARGFIAPASADLVSPQLSAPANAPANHANDKTQQQQQQQPEAMASEQQAAFAPILHYEPFVSSGGELSSASTMALPTIESPANSFSEHLGRAAQQTAGTQLIFKSSAQQRQQQQNGAAAAQVLGELVASSSPKTSNTNYIGVAAQQPRHTQRQPAIDLSEFATGNQQAGLLFSGATVSPATMSKQTPVYSFVGELDTVRDNNGAGQLVLTQSASSSSLELSPSPSASSSVATQQSNGIGANSIAGSQQIKSQPQQLFQQPQQQQQHFTNNGQNNFIINTVAAPTSNNNRNHPAGGHSAQVTTAPPATQATSSAQQQQQQSQLVFSPHLSRAFFVGSPPASGGGGGGATTTQQQANNEILDTKSQLFIPSPMHTAIALTQQQQRSQQQQQVNNGAAAAVNAMAVAAAQLYRQQQQRSNGDNSPASAATANSHMSTYLSPGAAAMKGKSLPLQAAEQPLVVAFGGPVSGAQSVPLSPASSSPAAQSRLATYRSSTTSSDKQQAAHYNVIASNVSAGQRSSVHAHANAQPNSLSSSLVSSPLATMFDVFGVASQYLMRFKPSALISPSAFAASFSGSSGHEGAFRATTTTQNGSSFSDAAAYDTHPAGPHALLPLNAAHLLGGAGAGVSSAQHVAALVAAATHTQPSQQQQQQQRLNPSTVGGADQTQPQSDAQQQQQLSIGASSPAAALLFSVAAAAVTAANNSSQPSSTTSTTQAPGILARLTQHIHSATSGNNQNNNNLRREDVCGRTIQSPQRRIIGGEGARYGEFPYQVHIKIAKHQCGGALVDRQSIVTAAHCVYHFITRAPVSKLQIVIGAYDIEDEQYQELPPQYFKVNKVKLHPNFRFSASHPDRYDVAILKLDKPVKYTDNVLPVCLPERNLRFENMIGTVTGFGKTDPSLSNRYGTRLLQKVDVPIIENQECERWHRTRGIDLKIFPEMMCAGYEDGLKDACVGDSGGPLVVRTNSGPNGAPRWTLAGITSAGFGCAQSRQPGIYHRVSHTVDWILNNLD